MAITIYDIAKEAGVSITSVSRVLNNKGEISAATRARVQTVLDKYNYAPNQIARGLASKNSCTVGIVALDLRVEHHAALVHHMEYSCSTAGYSCIVCSLAGKPDRFCECLDMLIRRRADGIILTGSVFAAEPYRSILERNNKDIPCIIVNSLLNEENIFAVLNDEEGAFAEAVHFLHEEKGRSRIALVGCNETESDGRKLSGYMRGVTECGLESSVVLCGRSMAEGAAAADMLPAQTDAALCVVDSVAVGLIHALADRGASVPKDIAVIGADNSAIAEACLPQLTSIDVQPDKTGEAAVRLLMDAIDGKADRTGAVVPCRLVERSST